MLSVDRTPIHVILHSLLNISRKFLRQCAALHVNYGSMYLRFFRLGVIIRVNYTSACFYVVFKPQKVETPQYFSDETNFKSFNSSCIPWPKWFSPVTNKALEFSLAATKAEKITGKNNTHYASDFKYTTFICFFVSMQLSIFSFFFNILSFSKLNRNSFISLFCYSCIIFSI